MEFDCITMSMPRMHVVVKAVAFSYLMPTKLKLVVKALLLTILCQSSNYRSWHEEIVFSGKGRLNGDYYSTLADDTLNV